MLAGVRFLPPAVMMMSFLRPVIERKPSSSIEPRSPVCSQPSSIVPERLVLASCSSRWKMFGPLIRISPSSAILISLPGSARPTVPNCGRSTVESVDDRRGLGHAVALEHRHAAGVEELEDLLRDRRRAAWWPARSRPPNTLRTFLNSASSAASKAPAARPGPPGRPPGAARTFSPSCAAPVIFSGSLAAR